MSTKVKFTDGVGFEPTEPFKVQWFSRPSQSTTLPTILWELAIKVYKIKRARCILTQIKKATWQYSMNIILITYRGCWNFVFKDRNVLLRDY